MNRPDRGELRRVAFSALAILIITFALRAVAPSPSSAPDFLNGAPGPEVVVSIKQGISGSEIARILAEQGVVKSAEAFFRTAVSDPRSNRIAPGEHRLETRIPAKTALNQLLDPNRIESLVIVRDGARLSEIIQTLLDEGFTKQDVDLALNSVTQPPLFSLPTNVPKRLRLEGFLYPAFYSYEKGDDATSILSRMTARFAEATQGINWNASARYTPYQLLTIASLVESEGTPDVHGKVARVIYNRLSKGMPLQLDSTVHYIFNRRGQIQLSTQDTRKKDLYNTFVNRGLPPGPIGSPTLASIKATLTPEPGPWLYFVTVRPNETRFTDSYEEFLSFKAEYKKNLREGLFG